MRTLYTLFSTAQRGSRVRRPRPLLLGLLLGLMGLLASARTDAAPRTQGAPCADAYENDGVPAQARPLGLGETQAHTFCPPGDADWLTFYAAPGSAYQVTTTNAGPGVSTYVYLLAPDGQTLLARNDDAPGAQPPGTLHFTPATAGWYFLQAKNRGDQGGPDARYTIRLDRAGVPPTPLPVPPTAAPPPPVAETPAAVAPTTPAGGVPALVTGGGQVLPSQAGDAGSNGLPVFDAGLPAAQQPDQLAPNGTFEQARLLIPGAVYRHLNFVGNPAAVSFFAWHAKPFDCYAAQTGDLSPGLDTALLLWRPAPTREGRALLAQNDDAQAHSADLSSRVRWCNPTAADTLVVLEVRNYAGVPVGGAAGKTYSLALLIDPPPTPSPRPTMPPAAPPSSSGSSPNPNQPAALPMQPLTAGVPPAPTIPPAPPTGAPATATRPPVPSATPAASATPSVTPVRTVLPTVTGTSTPTPTPTVPVVTVDVVVYFGTTPLGSYGTTASGPDPGSGIPGLLVQVIDLATNHPLAGLATQTDAYGHARLAWPWQGSVQLTVPQLLQTQLVQARDLALPGAGAAANTPPGHLYVPIRVQPYPLPIVQP